MGQEVRKLQKAFLLKEELEGFLANLEKLKTEGSIIEEQYGAMKKDYDQRLAAVASEITTLKVQLSHQLEEAKKDLGASRLELDKPEARYKVGEVSLKKYQSLERKARRKIEKMESGIAELDKVIKAESSADVAGYTDILGQKVGKISIPEGATFTEFITSREQIMTPRTKVMGLVGGFLLFISVFFLKWVSFFGFAVSGSDLSGWVSAAGIICGPICIGAAFLAQSKARGLVYIGAGTLAVILFLPVLLELITSEELGVLGQAMVTIREGLYFYIISAIAVTIAGIVDFRRE